MKIALLGLPGAGKKTFFSLLTNRTGDERENPVTLHGLVKRKGVLRDGDTLIGAAPVHDERLVIVSRISGSQRTVFPENTIALCPDILEGDGGGKWLEPARRCDMLCVLLRGFGTEEDNVSASANMSEAKARLETELLLADLGMIETRLNRLSKEMRDAHGARLESERKSLLKIQAGLEREMSLGALDLDPHEEDPVKSLGLLSLKPVLWAYNLDENRMADVPDDERGAFRVSCRIEQEIMELDGSDERSAYMRDLGVSESGLDRLNKAAYDALGLISFYTINDVESRAWTIRSGSTAPEAAGKVHSDIQRGFIRVEVMKYHEFIAAGSEAAVKAAGKLLVKGRDYVVEDGDICHFLFNV